MSNLQPLVWQDLDEDPMLAPVSISESPLHHYVVLKDGEGIKVRYSKKGADFDYATGFATIEDAKEWAWNHYNEKMQPYVKPDSITDIANWFKAAKPEPTNVDICTQLGCHFEEVAEHLEAMNGNADELHDDANDLKSAGKTLPQADIDQFVSLIKPLDLLDALCDQIVTSTGVAYMMGFDIEGALKEVIRSNNSKMVKEKFQYDENGKMKKGESYSAPDLTPFVKQGE